MAKIYCEYEGKNSFFPLTKSITRVGRYPGLKEPLDLPLPEIDFHASRAHAVITQDNGRYWLEDIGSLSGTWINGKNIQDQGRVEWLPNTPAKMGKSFLTIIVDTHTHPPVPSPVMQNVPIYVLNAFSHDWFRRRTQ